MTRSRLMRFMISFIMVLAIGAGILAGQAPALAQPPASPEPDFRLDCPYPSLAVRSGSPFVFEIDLRLVGTTKSELFNISTTTLDGWKVTTTAAYTGKEVSAVQITPYDDPSYPVTETINVTLSPYTQVYPEPGEYKITFKATSDTYNKSIDLTGTVLPQYFFILTTETENLYYVYQNSSPSITIREGGDSGFTFNVVNKGTATIENLALSAVAPEGWKIAFAPETIPSLEFGMMQQVGVTLTPPQGENVPGDYLMEFRADNGTISSVMNVRVRVAESVFPAWVLMIIIAAVVLGLAAAYQKFFNKPRSRVAVPAR